MKPEKLETRSEKLDLSEDEKNILQIIEKSENKLLLNEVKEQSQLSGKKWDKAIKNLTSNKILKVEKLEEGLFVSLV
jgi:lysyl-tRNA synthetase class 2